ncbi:uncharacterized protein LOC110026621 [Phalaenopsis equestris]|uniref:uncharacterized protein LOC110026621 n=1 Tax=Phalaenopsis equestris TaxID=78828 RepID=UPI0009E5C932|nr:uncharacterized protein LOC110026621 [Phalaenopsis equestris]
MEASPSSNIASVFHLRNAAFDETYRHISSLYLGILAIWCFFTVCWAVNTWRNRDLVFDINHLHCVMAAVPLIKVVQLGFSFSFWYSCVKLQICSLWMSFGVYVTGILFQTASFMSFMLISHGYCIIYERLSVPERRMTAALGCGLYLTLVGYKAAIPYFTIFALLNYSLYFYLIFRHISQNLLVLREQLNSMEDVDVQSMHNTLRMKYSLFKKFKGTMQIVAVVEFLVYMNVAEAPDNYWLRLLVRESAQFCIFLYIGWTFRALGPSPHFSVMPILKSKWEMEVPPIYSIEMDATDFNNLAFRDWQFGVPTSRPAQLKSSVDPLLILVQNPCSVSKVTPDILMRSKIPTYYAPTAAEPLNNGHQV